MALSLGTLKAIITADSTAFMQAVGHASKSMSKFLHLIDGASDHILEWGKASAAAASESSEAILATQSSFARLLKDKGKADAFVEKLKEFAIATPFEFEDVSKLARNISIIGLEIDNVIPLMRVLGDQSAGSSIQFQMLVRAFSQMKGKGKLLTEEMNQLVEGGGFTQAWDIAAKKIGTTVGDLRDRIAKGEFFAAGPMLAEFVKTMSETTGGQMAQATTRIKGAWSSMVEDIKLQTGEAFIPINLALAKIIPKIGQLAMNLGKVFAPVVPIALELINILDGMLVVFNALPGSVQAGVVIFLALTAATVLLVTAMTALLVAVSVTGTAIAGFLAILSAIGLPAIIGIVSAVGVLVGSLGVLTGSVLILHHAWKTNMYGFRDVSIESFTTVLAALKSFGSGANRILGQIIAGMATFLSDWEFMISDFATDLINFAKSSGVPVPQWIINLRDEIDRTADAWLDFADTMKAKGAIGNVDKIFADTVDKIQSLMKSEGPKAIAAIKDFFTNDVKNAFINALPDQAKVAFINWLAGVDQGVVSDTDFADALKKLMDDLAKGADVKGSGLPSVFDKYAKALDESLGNLIRGIDDISMFASVRKIDSAFDDLFKNMFKNVVGGGILDKVLEDSGLGDLVSGGQAGALAAAFAGMSVAIGAIIGVLAVLIVETRTFEYAIQRIQGLITSVTRMLNQVIAPLMSFINIVFDIARLLLDIFFMLSPAMIQLNFIATAIGLVGAALVPIKHALQALVEVFTAAGGVFDVAFLALDGAMFVLFGIFKIIAEVILAIAWAMGQVWNGVLNAVIQVLELVGKIPGLGKVVDQVVSELEGALVDTVGIGDAMADLWALSWEDAKAEAEHIQTIEETTEALSAMTEELINVPAGFKIALARFNAADPGQSAFTATLPHAATGAIVKKKTTLVAGEAGPEAIIPLNGGGGFGNVIHIQNFYSSAESVDDLIADIESATNRRGFVTTGKVMSHNRGARFAAG